MGCDIHAYLECSENGEYWSSLTYGIGGRNYRMFGIMAGVRREDMKLFDPKGLPEGKLSWTAEHAHWVWVAPDDKPEQAKWDGWTDRATAERWIAAGYSEPQYLGDVLKRVTDPDHHSHSWLTSSELARCIDMYRSACPNETPQHEYVGMLGAMKAIEENGGKTRLVFWFDN